MGNRLALNAGREHCLSFLDRGLGMFLFRLEGVNTNSFETDRLASAVVGIAATVAEIINKKVKTASDNPAILMTEQEPMTRPTEYPNRYTTIPPNGRRCEFTGLKHAKLYHILSPGGIARRKVRVANLRTPGATRGQTLFHVGDMLRFLDELADANGRSEGESVLGADPVR